MERILDGRQASQLPDLMQRFSVEWEKQRELVPAAWARGRENQARQRAAALAWAVSAKRAGTLLGPCVLS